MVLQGERRLISQHKIWHIAGQIKELSVGCGALQSDIAIWEMMLTQKKQYEMPQHLVLCTGQLSMGKLVFKSMLLRHYIDTFYSNQTILQFCENWIGD